MSAKWGKKDKEIVGGSMTPPENVSQPQRISNKLEHVVVVKDKPLPKVKQYQNRLKKLWDNKKNRMIAIAAAVVLVAAVSIGGVWYAKRDKKEQPVVRESELTLFFNNNDAENVVKQYGKDYDASSKELLSTNYTEWDKAELDKAYFNLLYADKIGAFNQVYTMLSLIEAAQRNGLDIDDNSHGIDQSKRDAIRQRADSNAQKASGTQPENSNE